MPEISAQRGTTHSHPGRTRLPASAPSPHPPQPSPSRACCYCPSSRRGPPTRRAWRPSRRTRRPPRRRTSCPCPSSGVSAARATRLWHCRRQRDGDTVSARGATGSLTSWLLQHLPLHSTPTHHRARSTHRPEPGRLPGPGGQHVLPAGGDGARVVAVGAHPAHHAGRADVARARAERAGCVAGGGAAGGRASPARARLRHVHLRRSTHIAAPPFTLRLPSYPRRQVEPARDRAL